MTSDTSSAARRLPQRPRGSKRVASILAAAAEVFAEAGYEAATMKEFAQRANASIGTLYQYFDDKEAIAQAVRAHHVQEMERQWQPLGEQIATLPLDTLVDRSVDMLIDFTEDHPSYIPLLVAHRNTSRGKTDHRLRKRFAAILRSRFSGIPEDTALHIVGVLFQVLKGLDLLHATAKQRDRAPLIREFKLLLTAYLHSRLEGRSS